jgi:hypothetical protein
MSQHLSELASGEFAAQPAQDTICVKAIITIAHDDQRRTRRTRRIILLRVSGSAFSVL